ncbi:MAG: hypothetical protein GQ574_18550 [Crocinitomix sp.]|nr:hypothetical protein [Crocinitomix sp.]
MAKYRDLTKEELITFEKEFVDYLVVNGIVASDWERMKLENNEKAEQIVSLFSDVIMEGVLRKIKFLERRTKAYVQAVQCLNDKMLMVAVSCKDKSYNMSDFKEGTAKEVIVDSFEMHQGEKAYHKTREEVLFEMVSQGYDISDGQLFKSLLLATV